MMKIHKKISNPKKEYPRRIDISSGIKDDNDEFEYSMEREKLNRNYFYMAE